MLGMVEAPPQAGGDPFWAARDVGSGLPRPDAPTQAHTLGRRGPNSHLQAVLAVSFGASWCTGLRPRRIAPLRLDEGCLEAELPVVGARPAGRGRSSGAQRALACSTCSRPGRVAGCEPPRRRPTESGNQVPGLAADDHASGGQLVADVDGQAGVGPVRDVVQAATRPQSAPPRARPARDQSWRRCTPGSRRRWPGCRAAAIWPRPSATPSHAGWR